MVTPLKVMSGREIVLPPAVPFWPTDASHRAALVPSPGSGKLCFRVQVSTSAYELPVQYWVVTVLSRCVVQKLGDFCVHVVASQFWSHGTSGQLVGWALS